MKALRLFGTISIFFAAVAVLAGQEPKEAKEAAAAPRMVQLMHQTIQPGRSSERQRLVVATAQACDRLEVPNSWLDLQSLTGPREQLLFNPLDSFEELEQAGTGWRQLYATHRDLAHLQEEIDAIVESERTIVAVRREDLGYNGENVDLSEMRFMRVLEVRLFPGHESDFEDASRILAEASTKIKSDTPWLVYQVHVGMSAPAFLILVPMTGLGKYDDLLAADEKLLAGEGEEIKKRLEQIARESYASTESNLYEVRPEMSHVSKEWAAENPEFWRSRRIEEAKPEVRPSAKPSKM